MRVTYRTSPPDLDDLEKYSRITKAVIETIFWPEPYDYTRGYIFDSRSWYGTYTVLLLGDPPLTKSFRYLREAERWAIKILRERGKQQDNDRHAA